MKTSMLVTAILGFSLTIPAARAQQPHAAAAASSAAGQLPIQKTVEAYLRNLYAFGPETTVTVSAPKDIGIGDLQEIDIAVKIGENQQTGKEIGRAHV